MREHACIFLAIIRECNRADCTIPPTIMRALKTHLAITEQDILEVGELLKADIREKNATRPGFESLNARLLRIGPDNPWGKPE